MKIKRILASEIAALDSDVLVGGGTDDTDVLQAALDEALVHGGVHLVMDGAALVRGLKLHSNTTIECLTKDCGFYLADHSDCPIVRNANYQIYSLDTRNISLIGGTYNHNCLNQAHDVPFGPDLPRGRVQDGDTFVCGLQFYGVENLLIRDLVIRNQRTFGLLVCGFKRCTVENVWLDLIDYMPANNQDGMHFLGPGQFLTVKNVGGRVGDDFMCLGTDEIDGISSLTDVLVDGVYLDDADQAVRLLSRGEGRLDRVTVRNVTGTYHGLGFYINPWFPDGHFGNFGCLKFENIDLRPLEVHYIPDPFLFEIGGNIERISIQNVHFHRPQHKYNLIQVGRTTYSSRYNEEHMQDPHIGTLVIDGVTVDDCDQNAADTEYMYVKNRVDNVILRDIQVLRTPEVERCGTFLRTYPNSHVGNLLADRVYTQKLRCFADLAENTVDSVTMTDIHEV